MSKTQLSEIDRRRFLKHTWGGVGASLSLALLPGRQLRAAPRFGAQPVHPGRGLRRSHARTASCCGPAWPPSRPTRAAWAARPFRWAGGWPPTIGCATWWQGAWPGRRPSWPTPSTSRSNACDLAGIISISSMCAGKRARSGTSARHPTRGNLPGSCASPLPPARIGPAGTTPRTGTWWPTTWIWSSTWATTPMNTRSAASPGGACPRPPDSRPRRWTCAPIGCATRCTSWIPTCRRRTRASRSRSSGMTTRCRTTTPAWRPKAAPRRPSSPPGARLAYQAFYEHLPIRQRVALRPAQELRIYRRLRYGKLAEFTLLDDRQYRSDNPCGDGESLRCEAALSGELHHAGPGTGRVGAARIRPLGGPLEHHRPATAAGRAGAHPARLPRRVVLERRLGRLSPGTQAAAEGRHRGPSCAIRCSSPATGTPHS